MSTLENVNESQFEEVINRDGLTLVDFWAEWCGPCRMLTPTLETIQDELGDKVKIIKLNVDENPNIAASYRVTSIPFMMLYKSGESVGNLVGNQPKANIVTFINSHL